MAVVRAIAAATGTDPTDMDPIHRSLDPDALDALDATATRGGTNWSLTFVHAGQQVSVSEGDLVTITGTGGDE